jgi:HEAT repeat protein
MTHLTRRAVRLLFAPLALLPLSAAAQDARPAAAPAAAGEEPLAAVAGAPKLDAAAMARRSELLELLRTKKLAFGDATKPGSGPVLLHIAASAEPASVVAPAIQALMMAYALPGSKGTPQPPLDNAVRDILLARLDAADGKVRAASLSVLNRYLMRDPYDTRVADRLVTLFRQPGASAAQRYDAMNTLVSMAHAKLQKTPVFIQVILEACEAPEPFVRFAAMNRLVNFQAQVGGAMDAQLIPRLEAVWRKALQDSDPQMRGAGAHGFLSFVETFCPTSQPHIDALVALADDPLPTVRAAGAAAIGNLKVESRIAALAKLLDDPAEVRASMSGFAGLAGVPNSINFAVFGIESPYQVRHYAALALVMFSGAGKPSLDLPSLDNDGSEEGEAKALQARIDKAKSWYGKHFAKRK